MRSPAFVRLFIALWPTDTVRAAMAEWQSQWLWPEHANVVRPERLHITLHFLGEMPSERIRDLKYVLQPIRSQPFALHFARSEMWLHGTAVIRPDNSPTALRGLQARIGLALVQADIKAEQRAFRPHVTLARHAADATPPQTPPDFQWEANDGFVLVNSLPGGRGYEIIERFGA